MTTDVKRRPSGATRSKLQSHARPYLAWIAQNPLRQWRGGFKPPIGIVRAGGMIGASGFALQTWEHGAVMPSKTSLPKIAEAMGITTEELTTRWRRWLGNKPPVER